MWWEEVLKGAIGFAAAVALGRLSGSWGKPGAHLERLIELKEKMPSDDLRQHVQELIEKEADKVAFQLWAPARVRLAAKCLGWILFGYLLLFLFANYGRPLAISAAQSAGRTVKIFIDSGLSIRGAVIAYAALIAVALLFAVCGTIVISWLRSNFEREFWRSVRRALRWLWRKTGRRFWSWQLQFRRRHSQKNRPQPPP